MNWRKIRLHLVACLTAYLIIFLGNTALADNGNSEIHIFKMGTDVTVPAREIVTEAVAIGGDITILEDAEVTNDAVAIGGNIILKPNARIGGDAVAIGGEIVKEAGAIVDGSEITIFSNIQAILNRFGVVGTVYLVNAFFYLISWIVVLFVGIFLLCLSPAQITTISTTIRQHPWTSGAWGLGGIVAVILFSILFSGSIFGLILIPLLNIVFAIAGLLGAIAVGLWMGQRIFSQSEATIIPFLVGMLILGLISLIPFIGGLTIFMFSIFGLGAVLLSRAGTIKPKIKQQPLDTQSRLLLKH